MSISTVVTRGFSNGSLVGSATLVVTRGFSIGAAIAVVVDSDGARIKVYIPSNAQGAVRSRPFWPRVPPGVVGSTMTKFLFQAVGLDGAGIDITGWSIAGTVKNLDKKTTSAAGGTLSVDSDPTNAALGYFEWMPSGANLAIANLNPGYELQFTLTSGTDLVSLPHKWSIYEKND